MSLAGKKVLVTGADGFIGSHLTETLVKMGANVRAFALYNSFNDWGWIETFDQDVKDQIDVFTGDIRDPHGVKKSMQDCDIVFHLASLIAIPYSYHSPDCYVDTNIKGTLNVMQAARELGVEKVLHTSTSEVYGTAQFVPITEEHPLQGQSPYSATKIGADQIAYSFFTSFELPVVTIRPFNTYGPRQSCRAIIPTIIAQIAAGAKEIQLGALTPSRDFNYVEDTVAGFIAGALATKGIGEVVNLGSNYEVSIGDTVKLIVELMGRDIPVVQDPARMRPAQSEVERLWACNKKAKKLFDWEPQHGGLEGLATGLKKTIDWFTDSNNLKRYKPDIYNI